MPKVQHPGGKPSVLAGHPGMEKPDHQVGILLAPARIGRIEAVDVIEIRTPDGKIARPAALPVARIRLAQRPEGKVDERHQPVDVAAQPLTDKGAETLDFRLEPFA